MSILSTFHIEVRRDYILVDALKEASKKKFDPFKTIKVSHKSSTMIMTLLANFCLGIDVCHRHNDVLSLCVSVFIVL